jgi:hypothetical protein
MRESIAYAINFQHKAEVTRVSAVNSVGSRPHPHFCSAAVDLPRHEQLSFELEHHTMGSIR